MQPSFLLWLIVVAVASGPLLCMGANLVRNGGFESLSHWDCWYFQCSLSDQAHSGQHSVKVTERHSDYQGPVQNVPLTPGHSYDASAYVKLLTQTDNKGEQVKLMGIVDAPDGPHYQLAAILLAVHVSDGWVRLTGRFTVPNITVQKGRFKVYGPRPGVEFLVDDVSLTEVTQHEITDWRNVTDSVINSVRKSDIHIQVSNSRHLNPADVTIQIIQKKKSFPWGTAVKADLYNNNAGNGNYRDFIHRHFNWAVLANALKWPMMERQQGHLRYEDALRAIHGLKSHGLKMRGHCLVWSVPKHVPDWVKRLTGDELRHAVQRHINDAMNVTRGLLDHWDVNNENLHGQWFQDTLHDPGYNLDLFRIAQQADPGVKLFLNDYSVVVTGHYTQAYLHQAQQFKAANVGLYGMGVQGHFRVETQPDPNAIKRHLDTLAEAGVPIWITELDAVAQDEDTRARYYEMALRALYGHPAVQGIIFWGFWGPAKKRGETAALVKGDNLELTAAGRRVLDLLEREWMTDETHVLAESGNHFTVRGFHGDYELHVHYQGQEVSSATQRFTLGKQATTVHLSL